MKSSWFRKCAPALISLLLFGCGPAEEAPCPVVMNAEEKEAWEIDLVEMRIERNEAFMDTAQTPLLATDLPSFEGLNYYYPNAALRFRVPFETAANPDTILLAKRHGKQVPYLRRGTVSFQVEGKKQTLAVFGPADPQGEDFLWLPFYDPTNQAETFAGGRYLDLEPTADGTVELDFNYAYNPLCDYNPDKFNCALPPQENTLPFPVRAGEKRFRLEE